MKSSQLTSQVATVVETVCRRWRGWLSQSVGIALFALTCSLAGTAGAQERVDDSQWKRGYHGFGALCRAAGLEPTERISDWSRLPAERSLLIVLGRVDHIPIDLVRYIRRGGAVLIASDRGDSGTLRSLGIDLLRGPQLASQPGEALHGYADCPVVTDFDADHPLTRGLRAAPANRPGALRVLGAFGGSRRSAPRWDLVARLPLVQGQIESARRRPDRGPAFLAALETSEGGRAIVMADQSVLANQMLFYGDNALLATRMLAWLRNTPRTTVLILDNRELLVPPMPELVEIEVPPPTPQEVRQALQNLPPELLVDFANLVVTTAEDEGLLDGVVAAIVESIPPRDYQRLLILGPTAVLGLVVTRRLFSRTGAAGRDRDGGIRRRLLDRGPARLERQQAAATLLCAFRDETARETPPSLQAFAGGLSIAGQPWRTRVLRRAFLAAAGRLGPGYQRYWTHGRLRRLDKQIQTWRRLHQAGALQHGTAPPSATGPA